MVGEPPIGPTAAGTLEGKFDVKDDGSAEYRLPLDTPAGRNGIEPHLSLVYNSRAGSGVLGPGWSLEGIHRITRCKRTYGRGAETGQPPASLKFTSSDELCLDSEQLVAVAPGDYRTKRDQQSRIVVTSSDAQGPVTFTVYRKNGTIEYYGDGTGHATTKRLGNIDISGSAIGFTTVTREWLMSRLVDRHGNTMTATYDYPMFSAEGVQVAGPGLPKTLSYTSNPGTGRAATKTVTFVYTTVPELQLNKFDSGVPVGGGGQLLTEIDVTAPRPVVPGLVTKYKLNYVKYTHTRRSLLRRVQRCGGDGTCMAPTIFDWSRGEYSFQHVDSQVDDFHPATQSFNSLSIIDEGRTRHLVAGDINGDGRQDLLYRTFLDPSTTGQNTLTNLRATKSVFRLGTENGFSDRQDAAPPIGCGGCGG